MRASTVDGWDTTSDTVNPRKPVVGASDGRGAYPSDRPVHISDLAATIYHALGLDPRAQYLDIQGQQRYICDGNPVLELF